MKLELEMAEKNIEGQAVQAGVIFLDGKPLTGVCEIHGGFFLFNDGPEFATSFQAKLGEFKAVAVAMSAMVEQMEEDGPMNLSEIRTEVDAILGRLLGTESTEDS